MPNLSSQNKVISNDSLLLIDKPIGLTSFGVVARLRRLLSQQIGGRAKVGHAGTLDPFASGLLLVLTGKMCRQAERFLKLDKVYQTTFVLGWTTPTLDVEGTRRLVSLVQPSRRQVEAVLQNFVGEIWQVPPEFSALKIKGRRAYDLARQGQEVIIPARKVIIRQLEIIKYDFPFLEIRVGVSSGTYIRALARDIGVALGVGAYCQALRRLEIANYGVNEAAKLADFGITD